MDVSFNSNNSSQHCINSSYHVRSAFNKTRINLKLTFSTGNIKCVLELRIFYLLLQI